MKEKIKNSSASIGRALMKSKVVDFAKRIESDIWWDELAGRLIKSGHYKIGRTVVEGIERNKIDLRKELESRIEKKGLIEVVKEKFQNRKVSFMDLIKRMGELPNDRDVRNAKLLLTRIAVRKACGKEIKGMSDIEIRKAFDKIGDVDITVKEIGNVMRYIKAGYGDKIAVQFIEAYLEELAKDVLEEYLGDLVKG